ncbi:MAG: RNA polymerase sigma factor [Bacteroidetes bacterium]|nr:RNA polymerase sigma factor [Bacteroidota bacterium]
MRKLYRNIHHDIIDRCKKKEQKAQFELYKLYYKAMYNTCFRIVQNTAEAEDIMQESFLSAFSKIKSYKGKVSFGAWLKRIVVNKAIDAVRKKKEFIEQIDEKSLSIENQNFDIYIDELNKEKVKKIQKAVNQLPDGYRIVLTLFLFEGYDHEEISKILNISNSTSRSQYARAKTKLKKILAENNI